MDLSSQRILLAGVDLSWLNELRVRFEALGHRVQVIGGEVLERNWLDGVVDIVIMIDSPETRALIAGWRDEWSHEHPLMVLLSDTPYDTLIPGVDIVLGFDARLLEQQILACYRMHHRTQMLTLENETLQVQLSEQHKAMREFEILKNAIVRNIAHELKTPLLQVKSAIALLGEETDSKLVTYATNATAKLEVLIKNIAMLGTSLDIQPIPIIPRDVVESARRSILRIWEHKDADKRILLNLAPHLDPIMADKQGLNTVLQLLLDNALKFSTDEVEIRVEMDDEGVVFSIIDKGIGIAPEKLNNIFDLFVQLDNSSTRRHGGIGVGLSLVKLILDHHGTTIEVESKVGEGTCFRFRLPRMDNWQDSAI